MLTTYDPRSLALHRCQSSEFRAVFHGGKLTSFACQVLSLIKSLAEFSSIGIGVACTCKDDRFFLLEPRACHIPAIASPAFRCPPRCKPRLELHAGRNLLNKNNNFLHFNCHRTPPAACARRGERLGCLLESMQN